jgi:hypothetical protein
MSGGTNVGNCGLPKGISKLQRSAISSECVSQSWCSLHAVAKMKSPVHAFLWMLLAKQGQLANGLYNVKFHPVIRQLVMNRRTCHDRHAAGGELIKVIGKQFGQPHIMAYGNQTFGKTV